MPATKPHSRAPRGLVRLVAALAVLGLSPALGAVDVPPVVPESIVLTEKELQKPEGAALERAQAAFRESRGADPERTLQIAQEMVALAREAFGVSHGHYARALTNLALAQAERRQFDAAVENYVAAIRAHERASRSISSNDLINPLHGLAGAYVALGEPERARPFFLRAQNIIERAIPDFLRAQHVGTAVPEFVELTEADLGTPSGAALARAQAAFRLSLEDDPERALELAKDIVALTSDVFGEAPEHVSRALTNLAIVQVMNQDYEAPIENFAAAIRARDRESGTLVSRRVINPLLGLASAYLAIGAVERAIPAYERAIHVSHVNDGPNNLDQAGIVDALSRAYFLTGDHDAAREMQDLNRRLFDREPDHLSDKLLEALEQRAAWLARAARFDEATQAYDRLALVISDRYGDADVRLIEPLVAFAETVIRSRRLADRTVSRRLPPQMLASTVYSEVRQTLSEQRLRQIRERSGVSEPALEQGLGAMERAVRIARDHAGKDPARLARTLVKQGDWLVSLNQVEYAMQPYREAWNILNEDPALHGLRDRLFATPVAVARVSLRSIYVQRTSGPANSERYPERGYAVLAFDVDTTGRPVNVRVVAANPAGLLDTHLVQQMRRFRYRPAFSDGEPRTYTGLTYRHTFHYDASRLSYWERDLIERTTYGGDRQPPYSTGPDVPAPESSSSSGSSSSSP